MKPRVVLYGHAAYHKDDKTCQVPENTTITFYAPLGALLDQTVCAALINKEEITRNDIEPVKEWAYFMNKNLDDPRTDGSQLETYPKTFYPGDTIPNYYLNAAAFPEIKAQSISHIPTKVVTVNKTTFLSDLLEQLKGEHIHWAGCSFSKTPDKESKGYGYAVKFKKTSKLKELYSPTLTEEQKKEKRALRFQLSEGSLSSAEPNQFASSQNAADQRSTEPSELSRELRETRVLNRNHPYRRR